MWRPSVPRSKVARHIQRDDVHRIRNVQFVSRDGFLHSSLLEFLVAEREESGVVYWRADEQLSLDVCAILV